MNEYRNILYKLVKLIHYFIVTFLLFGFLLPLKLLYIHAFFLPFVCLHWKINNNTCILTTLECKIENKDIIPKIDNYQNIKKLLARININIDIPDNKIHDYIVKYLVLIWVITIILIIKHNKSKPKN
jgi:hypothetical protein